jgi:hypothetical protein
MALKLFIVLKLIKRYMQGLLKVSEEGVTVLASHVNGSKIR